MNALRSLSIRWRITLGTLAIAVVLSAAAVVTFRSEVQHILSTTTTTLLHHDASPYIAEISATPVSPIDPPGRGQLVAVVDPEGNVRQSSLPRGLVSDLDELITLKGDQNSVVSGDDTYRVISRVVATSSGDWHIVTARNDDSSTLALAKITQALAISAVVLVFAFALASWLLTGAALRPVARMRRQARALVAEGSTEPLPTGPAKDEISDLAATLNEFITEVRESVDRERQLVSDASHELRTPLAILMTQLELAHLNSGDAAALEVEIDTAQQSVARLSGLATSLLELSTIEAGAPSTTSSWTDLVLELSAAVDRARMLAVAAAVTVDFDVTDEPSDTVYPIASASFGRIIDNLASNAITALPANGEVRIGMRHSAAELFLTVVDSGAGMAEEFLPVAFDRFTRSEGGRSDDGRSQRTGGSGLGLAIVQAIVTAAHGRVTLTNAAGFTVEVALPAARTTPPVVRTAPPAARTTSAAVRTTP